MAAAPTASREPTTSPDPSSEPVTRWHTLLLPLARRLGQLVALLFGISTLIFFLLRLAGDPAAIIAGEFADADTLAAIRARYGLDRPLLVQYVTFVGSLLTLNFGTSIASGAPAIDLVLERLPATLLLALLGVGANMLVSVPLGAWLGAKPDAPAQRAGSAVVFVGQGVPGFVVGLVLIQVFAVRLGWLPSIGDGSWQHWILPALTLASFMAPKLIRVLSANVSEGMREDYIRTARSHGASERVVLWRHALPNALLGATALVGAQLAFILSGALVTEVIFAWPGLGRLLVDSVVRLDFPIVQAAVCVIALLVFLANALTDILFGVLDPRLRQQR